MSKTVLSSETYIFNTPLEIGLRCTVILTELKGQPLDFQRLIYFDYLLVHFGDADANYESLHPATPLRSGEILIKRDVLGQGLLLMIKKKLVEVEYGPNGIQYKAPSYCEGFLNHFESKYMLQLRETARLLVSKFSECSNDDLKKYMMDNLDHWGGEFTKESLVRGI